MTEPLNCAVTARIIERQGCSLYADPDRQWTVLLLDTDGSPYIDPAEYNAIANYDVPAEDWMAVLAAGAMAHSPEFKGRKRSHIFYYAPGREWRIIEVEADRDGYVWIVNDDALTPVVA